MECTNIRDRKPKIGIAWADDKINEYTQMYIDAVSVSGGEAIYLSKIENKEDAQKEIEKVDAIIITGGCDISPELYSEKPSKYLEETNKERDISDILLIEECIQKDIPTFGTCRGMQLINIVCGGSLYQDIESQFPSKIIHRGFNKDEFLRHKIILDEGNLLSNIIGGGGKYEVNTLHHQCIKEVGKNLKVIARAEDEIVEAIVKTDNSYFYGVQWHPEKLFKSGDKNSISIYENFIKEAIKRME